MPTTNTAELKDLGAAPDPNEISFKDDPHAREESAGELDRLFLESGQTDDGGPKPDDIKPKPDGKKADEPKPDVTPKPDGKKADEPKPDGKKADEPKPDPTPKPDGKKADEVKPDVAPKPDDLDSIELPPYTKPKAAESFGKLKELARERIASAEKERDEARAKATEFEAKSKDVGKIPKEIEDELKELRDFRKKVDVEADPVFKEYDKTITNNHDSIYARLKESGVKDEVIAKIKEIGPGEVDWEPILAKLPSVTRRFVEAKLVANEEAQENKTRSIAEAKKNADEYLKKREKENFSSSDKRTEESVKSFQEHTAKLTWYKKQEPTKDATEDQKKAVEAHNKFVDEAEAAAEDALADDSPNMKAILALGYVQMLRLKREVVGLAAATEATKQAHEKEVSDLKAQLKEKEAFIGKIKGSSTNRLRDSSAPSDPSKLASSKTDAWSEHPSDALDRLRAEAEA